MCHHCSWHVSEITVPVPPVFAHTFHYKHLGIDDKSPPETYLINKFHCFFPFYTTNGTNLLVIKEDTIEFIRGDKHLRSERCRDELAG
jgi:hypothetical protein